MRPTKPLCGSRNLHAAHETFVRATELLSGPRNLHPAQDTFIGLEKPSTTPSSGPQNLQRNLRPAHETFVGRMKLSLNGTFVEQDLHAAHEIFIHPTKSFLDMTGMLVITIRSLTCIRISMFAERRNGMKPVAEIPLE